MEAISKDKNLKRVMFLTPNNVAGGAERVITSLCSEFSRKNIDTYFVTFDGESSFYPLDKNVKIIRLKVGTEKMTRFRKYLTLPIIEIKRKKRMKQFMKNIKPDVVVSFNFMTNVIGWKCCKELGIPIVLSERNDPLRYSRLKRIIMKYIYSRADGFVCQSDTVKQISEKDYGLQNITVIPNPLSENQVNFDCVPEKEKIIINVGRLIPQKNQALLIRAFAGLSTKFRDYSLIIYGEGPLRKELEQLVEQLGMNDRIFLPGIEKDAIKNHREASLFVLSSDFEGYPNVLVEAMANGIASISADFASGTARTIINDGVNGFLFPVGNEAELINCIEKVLSDNTLLRDVSEKGTELYEKICLDKVCDIWIQYLNGIFAGL